ncbi:MAG TPA: twin-arginine translocation signal domain-containing protein, partial [Gemmataceae bacterium]|nr:twin-arginine translocation signal domain-containing protein [Gemmataceae bacterium]
MSQDNQDAGLSRRDFLQHAAAGGVVVAGGIAAVAQEGAPPKSDHTATISVTLLVNGKSRELKLDPRVTLLDAL